MTSVDLVAIAPILVLSATAVGVLLLAAFARRHAWSALVTLAGLALGEAAVGIAWGVAPRAVTPLLDVDRYALFYQALLLAAGLAVAALSHGYLERCRTRRPEEFYAILLLALAGACVLVASSHFASFLLGLETLSVGLYALVAYRRARAQDAEAGLKYLVLAGSSSAFLLFGMALLYADTGTLALSSVAAALGGGAASALGPTAVALVLTGIGFKLALVPFHMWTPDVYEGAPAPVTGFLATVSKGAVFGLLVRMFAPVDVASQGALFAVFAIFAGASMVVGNLLALLQDDVKRLLAYSSIAHLGYLMVAFLAGGALGPVAATFYLVVYFATTLAAFGVVGALSGPDRDAGALADYEGLAWRRPGAAWVLTGALLSLAGIPLTGGFLAKFTVLGAGIGRALWVLVFFLVANSAIGLFYYLRVVITLFAGLERLPASAAAPRAAWPTGLALLALTLVVVWLGVYPAPLLGWIRASVGGLGLAP